MVSKVKVDDAARLMSEEYNTATRHRHMLHEVQYSFYNHFNIMTALGWKYNARKNKWIKFTDKPRAIDLNEAPKVKDEPILIIGSGPSLDEALPLIKQWQGDIMVSTSQAATCIYWGKEPRYIIALDPNSHQAELKADYWKGRGMILITHPAVEPSLIEFWKWRMFLFRKLQPQTPFYDNTQKIGYSIVTKRDDKKEEIESLIKAQVPMLGCVLAAQICIAKQLGYQRLFLVGADLGHPGGKNRFTQWDYEKGIWTEKNSGLINKEQKDRVDPYIETENGTISTQMNIFYSHQVITAWRITETDIVTASKDGVIRIFPYAPFYRIVRKQGKDIKGFHKKKVIKVSEAYLAKQNVYFLTVGKGIMPQEFKDPLTEVPIMLGKVKEALIKQGKGKDLDIDANMRRIKKLFKGVSASRAIKDKDFKKEIKEAIPKEQITQEATKTILKKETGGLKKRIERVLYGYKKK